MNLLPIDGQYGHGPEKKSRVKMSSFSFADAFGSFPFLLNFFI